MCLERTPLHRCCRHLRRRASSLSTSQRLAEGFWVPIHEWQKSLSGWEFFLKYQQKTAKMTSWNISELLCLSYLLISYELLLIFYQKKSTVAVLELERQAQQLPPAARFMAAWVMVFWSHSFLVTWKLRDCSPIWHFCFHFDVWLINFEKICIVQSSTRQLYMRGVIQTSPMTNYSRRLAWELEILHETNWAKSDQN